ncbi:hypothetical protein HMPREF0202_00430 [Cetobacterium somerae ATCC BAA-474]|uniref:DUF4868 domain-containing protein n=1 Tax=Cetobacterium somerae ATCC BAA-474 TaxID=1319815 RepID=U7VG20_9FUSO|nr:Kiwa anti-phage protein KwaB-like domain-containing protein [Cetobacterium somerae]ERT69738.1 hypothetical protein HMPREF0202_00430 [Cetobacterium somerae ATCC BAA-474]
MNIAYLNLLIDKISEDQTTQCLKVWLKENNQDFVKRVNIKADLKEIARNAIIKLIKKLGDNDEVEELNLENNLKNYYYIPINDVLKYEEIKTKILNCRTVIDDLAVLQNTDAKNLKAFIIEFEYLVNDKPKKIHLFIDFTRSLVFKKTKICLSKNGKYEELDIPYFTIPEADVAFALEEDEKFLVTKEKGFEVIFEFSEMYKNYAQNVITNFRHDRIFNLPCILNKVLSNKSHCKELYKVDKLRKYEDIDMTKLMELNITKDLGLTVNNDAWNISNSDNVKIVLSILNRKIGKDCLVNTDDFFIAHNKENI